MIEVSYIWRKKKIGTIYWSTMNQLQYYEFLVSDEPLSKNYLTEKTFDGVFFEIVPINSSIL